MIVHALEWFERHDPRPVSRVVTLQPTSPLRTAAQIDAAIALLDDPEVDSAVSVAEVGLPTSVLGVVEDGRWRAMAPGEAARRQVARGAMRLTGGIYAARRTILTADRVVGVSPAALVVDASTAIDVDNEEDLRLARAAVRRRDEA